MTTYVYYISIYRGDMIYLMVLGGDKPNFNGLSMAALIQYPSIG